MKKVYLLLSLFIIPVFFFSINKVSAATYEFEVSESNFEYINDDFYYIRDYALNHVSENGGYYVIYYSVSSSTYRLVFLQSIKNIELTLNSSSFDIKFWTWSNNEGVLYNYTNNEIVYYTHNTSFLASSAIIDNKIDKYVYLDSNISTIYDTSGNETKITYKDNEYVVNSTTSVPSLYQIYLDSLSDPYEEQKGIINNFYSTIATKIGEFVTNISTNYIFLLIFGIFTLIFVFELIRRYLI